MGPTPKFRYCHGTRVSPRNTSFFRPPSCTTQAKAPTSTAVNHPLSRQISKRQRQSIGGHQSTTVPPSIGPLSNVRQKPIATKNSQIVGQPTSSWQDYLADILSSWTPLLHFASLCRCFCSSPLRCFAARCATLRSASAILTSPFKWPYTSAISPTTAPSSLARSPQRTTARTDWQDLATFKRLLGLHSLSPRSRVVYVSLSYFERLS